MKVIFTFNTHNLACKATAEGVKGARVFDPFKPPWNITNETKL